MIDEKTLAIPDRPGNHRLDTFENILETGRIGLMFMVPNRTEVVRVNGSARIVRDLALRECMAISGRVPEFAILVRVEEAFHRCGKAVIRSRLWQPDRAAPADGLPTDAQALIAHAQLDRPLDEMERIPKSNDENRLHDEWRRQSGALCRPRGRCSLRPGKDAACPPPPPCHPALP